VQAENPTTVRQRRADPFSDLTVLLEALPDDDLLSALRATRHTGRPGYAIPVVWRSLVASFYLGIVHDTDLVRALEANPLLASVCGIGSRADIPSVFAIGRFRRKLTDFREAVAGVLTATVNRLKDTLPNFGETIAFDATDVKAWANGFHQETDPDAGTGAKKKADHRFYWYGYKVNIAVDAASELPVWFNDTHHVRAGYKENPPGAEGWRSAPVPLDSTIADPLLDTDAPSTDWAIHAVRGYIDGTLSFDQLYRCAFDLIGYRALCYETLDDKARERELIVTFIDALWTMCLSRVLHDDETELSHYLPQWLGVLEQGASAWKQAVDAGEEPPFVELD
jgi:hypothetical protein